MSLVRKIAKKIYHVINALIRRGRWFNEVKFPDCRKFWTYNTFNTEVVNLGSTSGLNAFNYEGLPIKGANWALGHNPLSGDFAILKNYESYLNPGGSTCIISLCVFSSLSGSYEIQEDRYYTLLYPTSIPHFSYRKQQEVKGIRNAPLFHYPIFGLLRDLKAIFIRRKTRVMSELEMQKDADMWYQSWLKEFSISDIAAPLSLLNKDGLDDAADILNNMISFCKERNITPVLVLPPMYHTLAEKFTLEARNILLESLISKVNDKSVRFLNYMDDTEFNKDATLFQNSFLMNEKGAKLFTRKLLDEISFIK